MSLTTFDCPKCGKSAFPSFILSNAGKLVAECRNPECMFSDQSLGPADFNKGIAAMPTEGAISGDGWSGKTAVVVDTSAPATVMRPQFGTQQAPTVPQPLPVMQTAPAAPQAYAPPPARAPGDVIAWIQERSIWLAAEEARIDGEIASAKARRAGTSSERKRLMRMLRAAEREDARTSVERSLDACLRGSPPNISIRN